MLTGCAAAFKGPAEPVQNQPPMQRWAEDVAGTPIPAPAHTREPFQALREQMSFADMLRQVGAPSRQLSSDAATRGGVLQLYEWELDRGERVRIATPNLDVVEYVELLTRDGKQVRLITR